MKHRALTLKTKNIVPHTVARAVPNVPQTRLPMMLAGTEYSEKRTNMKQHKLAQKRHKRNLKRKNKTFDNAKHNKNILEYCKKLVPPDKQVLEL